MKKLLLISPLLLMLFSCVKKDVPSVPEIRNDCVYIEGSNNHGRFIDEQKNALMQECRENNLSSKKAIEENIKGEWKLIGFHSVFESEITPPCIYLTVLEDRIIMDYDGSELDTTFSYSWEIVGEDPHFRLNTEPYNNSGLFIQSFCENYMFEYSSRTDGNNYLYEKVK